MVGLVLLALLALLRLVLAVLGLGVEHLLGGVGLVHQESAHDALGDAGAAAGAAVGAGHLFK